MHNNVEESAVDSTMKEVIEVVSKASSTMLEKATVSELQYYTIRDLDSKLTTNSDIEQYKLMPVRL